MSEPRPRLVVVSGPSGVGKSTLIKRLRRDPRVFWSVSATTRPPRPGERDGVDYHFLDDPAFVGRIDDGGFLEHALVHGNRYGTLRAPIDAAVLRGELPLLDVDVQGADALMGRTDVDAIYIFVAPPTMDDLERRLRQRGSESGAAITRRLRAARGELEQRERYDHEVVNDELPRALAELVEIIRRETGIALETGEEAA